MSLARLLSLVVLAGCSEYDIRPGADTNGLGEEDDENGDTGVGISDELGGITGRICSPSENSWVVGADVWVELENGDLVSTTTDQDGYFTLTGIPIGDQTIHVQKGSFSTDFDVVVEPNQVTELAEEECLQDEDVAIAVISGDYDYIEGVLDNLGFEYTLYNSYDYDYNTYESVVSTFLRDPQEMEQYDVIFFNCGMATDWEYYESEVANNLRDYVENGGSVYASDWAYWITEASYPNMLDFYGSDSYDGEAQVGDAGTYDATVLDADMVSTLGSNSAEINYDLGVWIVPTGSGSGVPLIRGTVSANYGYDSINAVLAARQYIGDGQMLYTSFHNEQQTTWHMDLLLEEIIFSL